MMFKTIGILLITMEIVPGSLGKNRERIHTMRHWFLLTKHGMNIYDTYAWLIVSKMFFFSYHICRTAIAKGPPCFSGVLFLLSITSCFFWSIIQNITNSIDGIKSTNIWNPRICHHDIEPCPFIPHVVRKSPRSLQRPRYRARPIQKCWLSMVIPS